MDHPKPFDVTISLLAVDLELTPHRGNPASAIEAVREEIEAIPGASWVSVGMVVPMQDGNPLIERLEPVGWVPEGFELPRRLGTPSRWPLRSL